MYPSKTIPVKWTSETFGTVYLSLFSPESKYLWKFPEKLQNSYFILIYCIVTYFLAVYTRIKMADSEKPAK